MKQLEFELKNLRQSLLEMNMIVESQVDKACKAFANGDRDLAMEVITNERRVNAYELKINTDCENILALFQPVAIDLRFVMAGYNISATLERIADNADGIARYVLEMTEPFCDDVLTRMRFTEMVETVTGMLNDALDAFEEELPGKAYGIHNRDLVLNEINIAASGVMVEMIKKYPDDVKQLLFMFSTIKKIERIGDLIKNIAEELVFYIEAKVIKHMYTKKSPEK